MGHKHKLVGPPGQQTCVRCNATQQQQNKPKFMDQIAERLRPRNLPANEEDK